MDHPDICQSCKYYNFDSRLPCAVNINGPTNNLCGDWEKGDLDDTRIPARGDFSFWRAKVVRVIEDPDIVIHLSPDDRGGFRMEAILEPPLDTGHCRGRSNVDANILAQVIQSKFTALVRERNRCSERWNNLPEIQKAELECLEEQLIRHRSLSSE